MPTLNLRTQGPAANMTTAKITWNSGSTVIQVPNTLTTAIVPVRGGLNGSARDAPRRVLQGSTSLNITCLAGQFSDASGSCYDCPPACSNCSDAA